MDVLFLIGRILYALIFLMSGLNHFMKLEPMAQYAQSKGVPSPQVAVIGSGVLLLLGGLSVLLGFYPAVGLILLVVFLVPTTLLMHNFWTVEDPMQRQMEMVNFLKNLALLGAALMLLTVKGWPFSL